MSMCDVQRWAFAFIIFQIKTSNNSIGVAKSCFEVMSLPDHAALSTVSLAAHRFHWVVLPIQVKERTSHVLSLWSTAAKTVRRPPRL